MPATLGRYELIAEIGRGGMADVKLALQRGPGGFEKLVVLKLVHEELASQKQVVDMLLDEAKLAALIKHPNVVDIYELGEADGRYFIAMEYLEGEPLLAVLDKGTGAAGKPIDALSMARIVADTAEGLDAAHQLKTRDGKSLGVVHHDISLGNIFVLYSGQVKLLDFGVAKASRTAAKTDQLFGKLAYMAPEKLDERAGDRRSDIWSLGCVLWEALTFKRLFKGATDIEIVREVRYVNVPPPSQVNPDVPAEFDPIVQKALQRDPFRRYQTAHEMGTALEEVLSAKGYPSKNFRIAAYMMGAFSEHIAARERLLRQISGANRPSAEVIDAAFSDTHVRKESTLPVMDLADFEPAVVVTLPEGHTGANVMAPMSPSQTGDDSTVELLDADVVDDTGSAVAQPARTSGTHAATSGPTWERGKHGHSLRDLQERAQEERENPGAARRRRMVPYALGGSIALLVLVIAMVKCGGDDAKPLAAGPATLDAAVAVSREADAVPGTGAPRDATDVATAAVDASDDPGGGEIEMAVDPPETDTTTDTTTD
nr:serine/threonine protein kinase [Deltaproteobacteria bacterium]